MDEEKKDRERDDSDEQSGQVSEVNSLHEGDQPIQPSDSVGGAPDQSSGDDRPQEGTQGPDAPPRHGIPEESNESSR